MDEPLYQKTQFGTVIVTVTAAVAAIELALGLARAQPPGIMIAAIAICAAIGVVFSSLTIAVSATAVEWWLAFHLFPQRVELTDVDLAATKRLPWYSGYGIRTNGRDIGWLVSGRNAIELLRRNGKRVFLSTADPAGALAAIHAAIGEHSH